MKVTFEKGIPGFDNLRLFEINNIENNNDFKSIDSLEERNIGFVAISPFKVDNDYEINLNDETIKELDIKAPIDVLLLNLITLDKTLEYSTINLKAPIIINVKNNKAKQIILQDDKYSIKHPLVRREKHVSSN